MIIRPASLLLLAALGACKPFAVHLGTNEPIKVDIKVKMDVYQHEPKEGAKKLERRADEDPETARRTRMGEVQALKNSRLVGENHLGFLDIRNQPTGEYGDYVKRTVESENTDRKKLMEKLAKERGVTTSEIERSQAALFRQSAFPGEWYEEAEAGGFVWKQKP
jgi:uncharacterized protein YdbL (DUF1318 family)